VRFASEPTVRKYVVRGATLDPIEPQGRDAAVPLRPADDLDTPKALAAVDGWTTDAIEYGGHDPSAPTAVATAVDALLGVRIQ
jgi:L-cysteine:1D-myo-inositol 2-amino-2-deoxy-alpha-D-glucopyranoside ligase